jgi:hypothetical protein
VLEAVAKVSAGCYSKQVRHALRDLGRRECVDVVFLPSETCDAAGSEPPGGECPGSVDCHFLRSTYRSLILARLRYKHAPP